MKKIRERTYAKKFTSLILGLIIGWIFYIAILGGLLNHNHSKELSNKITTISFFLSIVTMVLYTIISEHNYLKRLELTTISLYSDISIFKEREKQLISKAEAVVTKYLQHESDIQKSVAASRSGTISVLTNKKQKLSLNDLKISMESYPNLKADNHISELLAKIEESQNSILNSKMLFNEYVTYYNSAIIAFPAILFSGFWKLKPLQFYVDEEVNDI